MGLPDNAAAPDPTIADREAGPRLKVFVSYARLDSAFADRLVLALEGAGLDVLIDRRDLPLLEEWQRELLGFIRQADAVVFVISPASLQSKWCEWEISQVTELRKRLAPILAQPVAGLRLPEAVEKINFIDFTEADRFEEGVGKLAGALQLDLPWIKEHTRLAERSRLWLERDRANALLLRGIELEQAERWLLSAPRAAPTSSTHMPTAGHSVFIQESRQAEQARAQDERAQLEKTRRFQRRAAFALGAFAVLLVAAAIATLWQVRETNRKESILLAGRAAQWSDKGHCDQAMRFALLALPPDRALPLLWTWTAEAEAQLMRAAWGCPLQSRIALQGGISSEILRTLEGHTGWVTYAAFDRSGERIVTTSHDTTARIWNARTAGEIVALRGHGDVLHAAAFSPDGRTIATGSADTSIRLWDAKTGRQTDQIDGHAGAIWTLVFAANGTRVISASEDRTLRTSAVSGVRNGRALFDVAAPLKHAQFGHDGAEVLGWTADGIIRAWDVASGAQTRASSGPLDVRAMSLGGTAVATFKTFGSAVDVVDWSTGRLISSLPIDNGVVPSSIFRDLRFVEFNADGSRIVVGASDDTLRVFDVATGQPASPVLRHEQVAGAAFAPDSNRLLSFGHDRRALVWTIGDGKIEATIRADHDQAITVGRYGGDGQLLVTGSIDNSAWVVDAVRNVPLFRLWHKFPVTSADFSPNAKILATSSDKVRLWHTASGTELAVLDAPRRYESAARFSLDGKTLLVWGGGSVRIFDIALLTTNHAASLRRSVCAGSGGITAFTPEEMRDPILGGGNVRMPCPPKG